MKITKEMRDILLNKLKKKRGKCEECGKQDKLLIYFKDGNKDNFKNSNTLLLCVVCNKAKVTIRKAKKIKPSGSKTSKPVHLNHTLAIPKRDLAEDEEFIADGEYGGLVFKRGGRVYLRTRD